MKMFIMGVIACWIMFSFVCATVKPDDLERLTVLIALPAAAVLVPIMIIWQCLIYDPFHFLWQGMSTSGFDKAKHLMDTRKLFGNVYWCRMKNGKRKRFFLRVRKG